MSLNDLKKKCQQLIAANDLVAFFELLSGALHPDSEAASKLLQQSSIYNRTFSKEMKDTISRENANLEYNRITNALLVLVGNLQAEDLKTN